MRRTISTGFIALIISFGIRDGFAEDLNCDRIMARSDVRERGLFVDATHEIATSESSSWFKRKTLYLAYIIPSQGYTSGALIIKVRHKFSGAERQANPKINISRDDYSTPCSGKENEEFSDYAATVSTREYRGYHRFGLPADDDLGNRLDKLHADIGDRTPLWKRDGEVKRCAATNDPDISLEFLFGNLSEREPPSIGEQIADQVERTREALGASYNAPPEYANYQYLSVHVVPYSKEANKPSCYAFPVDVPEQASETDIMIIDADDARYPLILHDPQSSWGFRWVKKQKRRGGPVID
jgi:hypothetical protein